MKFSPIIKYFGLTLFLNNLVFQAYASDSTITPTEASSLKEVSAEAPCFTPYIIDHSQLVSSKEIIKKGFHEHGCIAISNVANFTEFKDAYVQAMKGFAALPVELQALCTPQKPEALGWSRGIETFHGKTDTYKGSYYSWFYNQTEQDGHRKQENIWPENKITPELLAKSLGKEQLYREYAEYDGKKSEDLSLEEMEKFKNILQQIFDENFTAATNAITSFEVATQNLARLIMQVGQEILPIIDYMESTCALSRGLDYSAIPEGEDDGNPNYCGEHRDHGIFTGLCPATYFQDGEKVSKPQGAGLMIEGKYVNVPDDVMIFQIGEVLELLTNGKIRATDHLVRKPMDKGTRVERITMAVFFDPIDHSKTISCDNQAVLSKYLDRFKNGMTYGEWHQASLEKYAKNQKK